MNATRINLSKRVRPPNTLCCNGEALCETCGAQALELTRNSNDPFEDQKVRKIIYKMIDERLKQHLADMNAKVSLSAQNRPARGA